MASPMRTLSLALLSALALLTGCGGSSGGGTAVAAPKLSGRLIWHSYDQYGWVGVRSWLADFETGTTQEITPPRVGAAMNYHFNADGSEVVFMGTDTLLPAYAWDVWIAQVTPAGLAQVTKLTRSDGREEDPKFSSDGTKIIFKHDLYSIQAMDRSALILDGTDQDPPRATLLTGATEIGMPYYLAGSDTDFLFAWNGVPNAIDSALGGTVATLYQQAGSCYYPVAVSATQFLFTWGDAAGHDQVYRGDLTGAAPVGAAFNVPGEEYADPCPMGGDWVCHTSTRYGGAGAYDLWIGNFATGASFNLDTFIPGSNHGNSDLGPCFRGTVR